MYFSFVSVLTSRTYSQRLKERFYRSEDHPYRIFQREIEQYVKPGDVLLDAGCGRQAEVLKQFRGKAGRLIGADLVQFDPAVLNTELELFNRDLANLQLEANSVDVIMSRSVLEHLPEPLRVYLELYRVLKPEGYFIFLTPNLFDYTTAVSKVIPNRLHPWIVSKTEGREEQDTFPAYYRSNSFRSVSRLAAESGFQVVSLRYLSQYPSYFMFSPLLFLLATSYERLITRFHSLQFLKGWLLAVLKKP